MARGRIQNRMEKRAEHEAYERRQAEDEEDREDEDEDEDEDEGDEEEAAAGDEEAGDEEAGDEDEPAPPPKKKKPAKEPKKAKPRSRTAKVSRMKLVWGVFNNSNVRVATYEYRQKQEAEEHATRLTGEKKSTHFVQPVKEPIEEKKEA
jgi:hypothetical protein